MRPEIQSELPQWGAKKKVASDTVIMPGTRLQANESDINNHFAVSISQANGLYFPLVAEGGLPRKHKKNRKLKQAHHLLPAQNNPLGTQHQKRKKQLAKSRKNQNHKNNFRKQRRKEADAAGMVARQTKNIAKNVRKTSNTRRIMQKHRVMKCRAKNQVYKLRRQKRLLKIIFRKLKL